MRFASRNASRSRCPELVAGRTRSMRFASLYASYEVRERDSQLVTADIPARSAARNSSTSSGLVAQLVIQRTSSGEWFQK